MTRSPLMRKTLSAVFLALICLTHGSNAHGDDQEQGQHQLTGPVQLLWEQRWDSTGSGDDHAWDAAVSPDGSKVYVTGSTRGPGYEGDYATVAYDSTTGSEVWIARHDGPASSQDPIWRIAVSPDGGTVYVTGTEGNGSGGGNYATLAYDAATGAEVWHARYSGLSSGGNTAYGIAVSPDGLTVFVTGKSYGRNMINPDLATLAYDAATGEELWVARYDSPFASTDAAYSIVASPDGATVFVTGSSASPPELTHTDWLTVAYDAATGEEAWVTRYDSPESGIDHARSIAISPDGGTIYATGNARDYKIRRAYATTVAYDAATSIERWVARHEGPAGHEEAWAIAVSPDGRRVFVAGHTDEDSGYTRYLTVAYDAATGNQAWSAPSHSSYAYGIAVTPDGETVMVTGDNGTVAYDAATGEESWTARFVSGHGPTQAEAVRVSPDGYTAFVTGNTRDPESDPADPSDDYFAFAYRLVVPMEIDIIPNRINPRSNAVIRVLAFGSEEFDVADVDVTTLRFGPNRAAPKQMGQLRDVNFDGITDLVAYFRTREAGIVCGVEEVALVGNLVGGLPVEGTGSIKTVGCHFGDRNTTTRQKLNRSRGTAQQH